MNLSGRLAHCQSVDIYSTLFEMIAETDDLIDGLASGSEMAFNKLFRSYYPALCFFGERIGAPRYLAEELAQDALLKLWDKRLDFPNQRALKVYLYVSVRNGCIKALEKSRRYSGHLDKFAVDAHGTQLPYEYELIKTDVFQTIYAAIESLPEQCARVVKLSYIDGLKNHEIAEMLAVSEQTVKNQKVKGLKRMKTLLGDDNMAILAFTSIFSLLNV